MSRLVSLAVETCRELKLVEAEAFSHRLVILPVPVDALVEYELVL